MSKEVREYHIMIRLKVTSETLDSLNEDGDALGISEPEDALNYLLGVVRDQLSGEDYTVEEEFTMGFGGPVNPGATNPLKRLLSMAEFVRTYATMERGALRYSRQFPGHKHNANKHCQACNRWRDFCDTIDMYFPLAGR